MTDNSDHDTKRPLSLGRPGSRLELRKPIETGQVRQSFPHGRSKTVQVEVRRKRPPAPGPVERPEPAAPSEAARPATTAAPSAQPTRRPAVLPRGLTAEERAGRARALKGAIRADEDARKQAAIDATREREEQARRAEEEARRRVEEEAKRKADEEARRKAEEEAKRKAEEESRRQVAERAGKAAADKVAALTAA
ncbi:MAG TPA: translation initiation factor IF-2 associated domain-containing protein, partial [Stellaceae bacterium]